MMTDDTKQLHEYPKGIEKIIRFYEDGLNQYRFQTSPSAQHLVEQTIKALRVLAGRLEQDNYNSILD